MRDLSGDALRIATVAPGYLISPVLQLYPLVIDGKFITSATLKHHLWTSDARSLTTKVVIAFRYELLITNLRWRTADELPK